jgi:meckelin
MLQFKREEENLCGHRGLLPGCDQQTYTILIPKNLRLFYERLISPISTTNTSRGNYHNHHQTMKSTDQNFERMISSYHNINRFLAAFIDHVRNNFTVDYRQIVFSFKSIVQ